jgi:branched-chain amino acid transport system ATP-binding protein
MTQIPTQPPAVTLKNVSAGYVSNYEVLHSISMVFPAGRCTLLVGPNGSGKSTVLKAIIGLSKVFSGSITLNGSDITNQSTRQIFLHGIAYVPADNRVFPALSVRENLEVVLAADSAPERAHRIETILSLFSEIATKQNLIASSLSGGEQQMLSIARAILGGARILLLDEPTAGLAPAVASHVANEIMSLRQAIGLSLVIAEHNLMWAAGICTDFYALRGGSVMDKGTTSNLATDIERVKRIFL